VSPEPTQPVPGKRCHCPASGNRPTAVRGDFDPSRRQQPFDSELQMRSTGASRRDRAPPPGDPFVRSSVSVVLAVVDTGDSDGISSHVTGEIEPQGIEEVGCVFALWLLGEIGDLDS
jgi:hypothetical protein